MSKIIKIFILLALFFLVVFSFLIIFNKNESAEQVKINQVCFHNNNCFEVEVARTKKEMEKGLMFRESLDKDKGMFFVFESQGIYPFWMKNTLIPLDIIWINENYEVVFIKENAEPCYEAECPIIDPEYKAKYVLEINGVLSKKLGLNIGDQVSLVD